MRLFAFALREYDELGYLEECSREMGFEYGWTSDYPTDDNLDMAAGYDALSIITNPMPPERLVRLYFFDGKIQILPIGDDLAE